MSSSSSSLEDKKEEEAEGGSCLLELAAGEELCTGGYPALLLAGNGCMGEEAASGYCGSTGGYRGRILVASAGWLLLARSWWQLLDPRHDTQPTETSPVAQHPSARLVTTQQPTGNKHNI